MFRRKNAPNSLYMSLNLGTRHFFERGAYD